MSDLPVPAFIPSGEEGDAKRRPLGKNTERGARYRERDGEGRWRASPLDGVFSFFFNFFT